MQDFPYCPSPADVPEQDVAGACWLRAVRTVEIEVLKFRGENEVRPDMRRVEGDTYARAAALR